MSALSIYALLAVGVALLALQCLAWLRAGRRDDASLAAWHTLEAALERVERGLRQDLAAARPIRDGLLDAMRARANAWATGDVAALRILPPAYQWEACSSAITEAGIGKRLGFGDAQRKLRAKWLDAAETALGRTAVSFATLSLNAAYRVNARVKLTAGVDNLTDRYPNRLTAATTPNTVLPYSQSSPFGFNGRFAYLKAGYSW